ncbi:nucleoside hydrolase [Microbacterium sp. KUDC0406]|uniref:nucleoside hydrolase n=1 Tax=Microbacterium sp. KUDC0406 TaxID=2909588 RepID=UPI001F293C5D|nr:nucleoside hydrolase [Microbacterium sp. KUDC0406]UJP10369.1 nucleoside hydrolase [Microbacterium sp. KUDC0406]
MSTPIILDCDPGHDDVFALWLAAAHPAIDLRAITTVGGNGLLEHTTRNARIACTVAGIDGVPIAAGAAEPLTGALHPAENIHGANALGGPELPEPTVSLDPRSALDLIVDVIESSSEPVTIVATGPLTNIAILARERPDVLARVPHVVWMGGSTGRGNTTPYAEFNAWTDPEAVALVLDSGVGFTMVGLNISHQALITPEVRKRIGALGTRTAVFGRELLDFFCATYEKAEHMPDAPLHDPITVALLADPSVATTVRSRLDIELHGAETRGATSVDLLGSLGRRANADIAMDLDVERFWRLIEEAVLALA